MPRSSQLKHVEYAVCILNTPKLANRHDQIHCGLPAPLIWDALRTWTINVTLAKPDIFLLRDHITLFSDIAKDWISGPPGDYEHFVPFIYALNLTLSDYTLRLFVNDHNIINNPSTVVDNSKLLPTQPQPHHALLTPYPLSTLGVFGATT